MVEPIIKCQNLNFIYNKDKENEFHALVNVNLEIYPKEYIIIFGPSGCGKSTLLNVIAGLELPTSGQIFVFGRNLIKMTKKEAADYHRRQLGMVFQQYNLITSLTVLENVALPQIFVNVRKGRRNRWARQLLDRFGILKQAEKIPTELSGGQQQRIGIARAIVNNPKIILADEPVGNLDSVSAKNVMEILADLNEKEKKTIILVTHNPENLHYGDRIIYMKDGIITREVVNKDKYRGERKKTPVIKTTIREIDELMRVYRNLSPEQINILIMPYKAKAFAHHFISTLSLEETKVLEDLIQRRLLGTISQQEFFEMLNKSFTEGGVGFNVRTAQKIVRRINRIIRIAYFIYRDSRQRKNEKGKHKKITDEEKTEKVTWYLLKTCYYDYYHHLSEEQIKRIKQAVHERLIGEIQKDEFYKALDRPFKEGGVGLNSKTAKAIAEELELVLILGFGIAQTRQATKKDDQEIRKETKKGKKDLEGKNGITKKKTSERFAAPMSVGEPTSPVQERALAHLVKSIQEEAEDK
jgi:putative ABC transport system ATP-binding protein